VARNCTVCDPRTVKTTLPVSYVVYLDDGRAHAVFKVVNALVIYYTIW